MKRKTTMERIDALRDKCRVLEDKIVALQNKCNHAAIKVDRQEVGFNGYSTDYRTYCHCQLCDKSWVHDGWCDGLRHSRGE